MENDHFSRRKTKISRLISEHNWEKASYLIRSILNDNRNLQVEQNSWLLIKLLLTSVKLKDFDQVLEVLDMREKMITSFTISDQITWQKLNCESLFNEGVNKNDKAIKLIKIWRELSQLLKSEKRYQELVDLNQNVLSTILQDDLHHFFWEPLLWWIYWSHNHLEIKRPSLEYLVKAHEVNPNKWFLNYILECLSSVDANSATKINHELQAQILKCDSLLPEKPSMFDSNQIAIEAVKSLNIEKLKRLLQDGIPPQGFPHVGGAWWTNLQQARDFNIVRILLDYGAWVDSTNQAGINSLMISVLQGDLSLFNLLLRFSADPLALTHEKSNLLHLAVRSDQAEMVKELLNCGLHAEWKDGFGRSAIDIALDLKLSKILQIMMD